MHQFSRLLPAPKNKASIASACINRLYIDLGLPDHAAGMSSWKEGFYLLHGNLATQRQSDLQEAVETYGIEIASQEDFLRLVFALETYYCLVLLSLGHRAATQYESSSLKGSSMFDGSAVREAGIFNYQCPKIYHWVINLLHSDATIKSLVEECDGLDLSAYDRDLIKHLFHGIFHRKLRHSLGEIYTPDWLAQLTINDATNSDLEPSSATYLDPTCGSGTFLVEILRRHLSATNGAILSRIYGIDINPISALAAKTNLLIMGGGYIARMEKPFWIPIFEADCLRSIFSEHGQLGFTQLHAFDESLVSGARALVVRRGSVAEGINFCNKAMSSGIHTVEAVEKLAAQLIPELIRSVDYVVGNPPWVNWEYLPEDYKRETAHIWQYYNLFNLKGRDSTFIKEDISALITYVSADKYLAKGGILAFVIKQSLFKSSRQGEGFRQFNIAPTNTPLSVVKVEDLSAVRAFNGIATRAAVLLLKKGAFTSYPVEYNEWSADKRGTFKEDENLATVLTDVKITKNQAFPVDKDKLTSGWTTSAQSSRNEISGVLGTSAYRARTGLFTGGLNAAFWMRIERAGPLVAACRNIVERAKNKLPEVAVEIERKLLFPFVTGSDIDFWHFDYSRYVLCTHTKSTKIEPLPEKTLRAEYPLGWAYLESLRPSLEARKGFAGWEKSIHERYFYALQRIGDYTFAPYKVAWRFISQRFLPVVIGPVEDEFLGSAYPIPNEKVIFVGLESAGEAYYLCGVISSTLHRQAVESFMVQTQIGPHVLDKLSVAKFDAKDPVHIKISELCRAGHGNPLLISSSIEAIDECLRKP